MKPELGHYPQWLREEICPDVLNQRDYYYDLRFRENEEALRKIHTTLRANPVHRVLFSVVIEVIRSKFKMYALKERCIQLEEQIKELKEEIAQMKREGIIE